jgi:K+ transporter
MPRAGAVSAQVRASSDELVLDVALVRRQILDCDLRRVIYYIGHEAIIPVGRQPGMSRWREALFAFMPRNAQRRRTEAMECADKE